eukprot:7330522-Prymnesium_polylepis.2
MSRAHDRPVIFSIRRTTRHAQVRWRAHTDGRVARGLLNPNDECGIMKVKYNIETQGTNECRGRLSRSATAFSQR